MSDQTLSWWSAAGGEFAGEHGWKAGWVQRLGTDPDRRVIASAAIASGRVPRSSGWARPANLFVCRLTACNGSRVRSDLTNGPISQPPLADLGNRAIEAPGYTLARTNRLLIFGLTSRPYYGNPEGADAVVGCPRVGADFRGSMSSFGAVW